MVMSLPEIFTACRRLSVIFDCTEKEVVTDVKDVLSIFDGAGDIV